MTLHLVIWLVGGVYLGSYLVAMGWVVWRWRNAEREFKARWKL